MSDYIGTREQVDEYVGSRLVEAAYMGSRKYYDAYSEVTGSLPLTYESRTEHILKNYALYGSASGAGVETENLYNKDTDILGKYLNSSGGIETNQAFRYSSPIPVVAGEYTLCNIGRSSSGQQYTFRVVGYDQNDNYVEKPYSYTFTQAEYISPTFTVAPGIAYVRLSYRYVQGCDESNVMLVEGSTAPSTYIPHGYKIPLTNTGENLFDYTARDTEKGFVSGYRLASDGTYDPVNNWGISEYIVASEDSNYVWRWTDVVEPLQAVASVGFYDSAKTFISGVAYNRRGVVPFTTPANTKYIRVSFLLSEGTTLLDCVLVRGSTAPTSYISYRSSTYPLYIGSSKLGAEEYVDYSEQKVYKRTENLLNCKTFSAGYLNSAGNVDRPEAVSSLETTYDSVTLSVTVAWCGAHTERMEIPQGASSLWFRYSGVTNRNQWRFVFYDANGNKLSAPTLAGSNNITLTIPQDASSIAVSVQLSRVMTDTFTDLALYDASLGTSYIPYLQPTDPPAPLPAITAYAGENTLSSTETVGTVTVKGRISTPST